jgi:GNAT superfamily N-acetyltransferase
MRDYVVATWGAWNADEAREQIENDVRASRSSIVVMDGQPVGLLHVDELSTHIHLDQLFILPEHQRKGVGHQILVQILERARTVGLPLRLWVLRINPATKFYERLGFKVIEQTPASLHLEHGPWQCRARHEASARKIRRRVKRPVTLSR